MRLDQGQRARRVEVVHQNEGAADQQMELRVAARSGVVERSGAQVNLALVEAPHLRHARQRHVRRRSVGRPLHRFRAARRTRGVDQHVVAAADEAALRLLRRFRRQGALVVDAAPWRASGAGDEKATIVPVAPNQRALDLRRQTGIDQHRDAARIGEHVGDLRPLEAVADGHQLGADLTDRVEQLEPSDTVVQHRRDRIAGAHADAAQRSHQAIDAGVQLPIGRARAGDVESDLLGVSRGVPCQSDSTRIQRHRSRSRVPLQLRGANSNARDVEGSGRPLALVTAFVFAARDSAKPVFVPPPSPARTSPPAAALMPHPPR